MVTGDKCYDRIRTWSLVINVAVFRKQLLGVN